MNTDKANYLRQILEYAVKLPQYKQDFQPGGEKETYCNLLARGVLNCIAAGIWANLFLNRALFPSKPYVPTDFHFDISSMNPGKPLGDIMTMTRVDVAYNNVKRMTASGKATAETHDKILPPQAGKYPVEVTPEEAQDYANEGIPIWITSINVCRGGHEAIVYPTLQPYDKMRGVKLAQAGTWNGIFFIGEWQSFGDFWKRSDSDIKYYLFPMEG